MHRAISEKLLTRGTRNGRFHDIWDFRKLQRLYLYRFFAGYSLASFLDCLLQQNRNKSWRSQQVTAVVHRVIHKQHLTVAKPPHRYLQKLSTDPSLKNILIRREKLTD